MTTATIAPHHVRTSPRRRPGGSAALLVAALPGLAACGADGPAGRSPAGDAAGLSDLEIASPAAPGGGQPYLSAGRRGGVWMSWTEPWSGGHRVAVSNYDGRAWSEPATVAAGDAFFVNWADFPSVHSFGDALVVHWLERGGQGTYDYGVRIAWSLDRGATWSAPWTPHDDDTPTEHGFVSFFERGGSVWAAWLDGRAMTEPGGPMSVRARSLPLELSVGRTADEAGGGRLQGSAAGPEHVVDERACECCQTDAVVAAGIPVLVYRDRAAGEIRDVAASRLLDSGWTPGTPVHEDGWVIGACPVNGPALAALDSSVAVAWFAAPDNRPRVSVAFSADGGASFGSPVRLDAGQPSGRVDVLMLDDGSALATWLEREGPEARILSRRVGPDGSVGDAVPLAGTGAERASGFPRIARLGPGRLMLAWTDASDVSRVRVAVLPLELWPAPS